MADRPADECPFRKPFPPGFDQCPAYQPSEFVGLDLGYRTLSVVWTCGNLEVRASTSGTRAFYARCRLGDAAARLRWVNELRSSRLERIRALQRELGLTISEDLSELWALKGRQLRAMRAREDATPVTQELALFSRRLLAKMEAFLEERGETLRAVDLPLEACRQVLEAAMEEFVQQTTAESNWRVPEHILERFPEDVRILFRPEQLAS